MHIKDGKLERISGFKKHPLNQGRLCSKAVSAIDLVYHPERILRPLKRTDNGDFKEISYGQAMDEIAEHISQITKVYGVHSMGAWAGEAIGFQQQEGYARRFIHALGSSTYLCAGSVCSVARYIANCLVQGGDIIRKDFINAGAILIWGANPEITHPPDMWQIEQAKENGAKLVVIDPRKTKTADKADLFIQIRPGTDGALAWGLCKQLIETDNYDHEFIEKNSKGFSSFSEYARKFTFDYVSLETGVKNETINKLFEILIENRPRIINYQGNALELQPNGFNNIRTIICLGGLCGAVAVKGGELKTEAFPHRTLWLTDEIPLKNSWPIGVDRYPLPFDFFKFGHSMTAMDHMLGRTGEHLKGLVITGANPAVTNPNSKKVSDALSSLNLLVTKDLFLTKTARLSDYVMPAGTFLERSELHFYDNIQTVALSKKIVDVPGANNEFSFWKDLADRLGFGEQYFPWSSEDDVNRWILEPSNISMESLIEHPEGVQRAPFRGPESNKDVLATPSGRFEFSSDYIANIGQSALPEYKSLSYIVKRDKNYPFILITGARNNIFCHSRIADFRKFRKSSTVPECEVHPEDASGLEIRDNDKINVVSKFGEIELWARVVCESDILPGFLQIAHGRDTANVNLLTDDNDNDPITGFPNMKIVAVRVEKA